MADSHAKNHDYHLVDPSPWPLTGSVGALTMAIGAMSVGAVFTWYTLGHPWYWISIAILVICGGWIATRNE